MEAFSTKAIQAKKFLVLFLLSLAAHLILTPFLFTVMEFSGISLVEHLMAVAILTLIYAVTIFFGIKLSEKIGLGLPLLTNYFENKPIGHLINQILIISIPMGILLGAILFFSNLKFFIPDHLSLSLFFPLWKLPLLSLADAVAIEISWRFFFLSLIMWLFFKFQKSAVMAWISIFVVAGLYAFWLLPSLFFFDTHSMVLVKFAINILTGITFGWLYWKYGLGASITSHFCANFTLILLTKFFS